MMYLLVCSLVCLVLFFGVLLRRVHRLFLARLIEMVIFCIVTLRLV